MRLRRRNIFVCALALLSLALAGTALGQSTPQEPRYFAIKGARIVPVSGPVIEEGTVVVANGLITAVGKDVPIPPEAWVIDGKGLTVYPGLIDSLTDLGLQAPRPTGAGQQQQQQQPAAPAQQQTQAARSQGPEDRPGTTPWRSAADELRTDDRRVEQWRNAGFTSALSTPRAGIFSGQGAIINLGGERPGEMVVKSPATLLIQLQPTGGLFVGFPGSLMGVISYVKQVYADTAHFAQAQAAYDRQPRGAERPQYDRTVRVIQQTQRENWPVLVPGNRSGQIVRGIELARQLGVRGILYGAQEGYAVAPEIAAGKLPVLVSIRWPERERDADPEQEESLDTLRFRDRAPSTPAALEKAGVKFAFYSDGITNVADIRRHTRKAIDAGLSADAALRAFTWNAAEILGVSDRLGSIEAGKIANLVVTDGDIFAERTKVKIVFVDGRKYEIREGDRPPDREEGERTPPPGVER
jgi:imidazolonepropionase-like amidohydrolase